MVHFKTVSSAFGVLAMSFCTPVWAQDAPQTYTVQSPQTQLAVLVRYDRGALIAGHDHVIQTQHSKGTIIWNPNNASQCSVSLSFPVLTLDVDPEGSRIRHGLKGQTSEGDKRKIKANMLGKQQLHAEQFPEIRYTAKTCVTKGERVHVTGDLTLRGVTKTVTSLLDITVTDGTFHAKGEFRATHDDFDMKPFTALAGALRNDNPLRFFLEVTAAP